MAYDLQISDSDYEYLERLPLSDRARAKVAEFFQSTIANVSDAFRNDPANRPHKNGLFRMDFYLIDFWGDRGGHRLTCYINDTKASAGVLIIVFVDHVSLPRPGTI